MRAWQYPRTNRNTHTNGICNNNANSRKPSVVKDYGNLGTIRSSGLPELFYFLAWRDMKVDTADRAGCAVAVIQPLFTMVIFTVVFGQIANISSEGCLGRSSTSALFFLIYFSRP